MFDDDHSGVIGWAGQMAGYQYYGKVVDEDNLQIFRRQLLEHTNKNATGSPKQKAHVRRKTLKPNRAKIGASNSAVDVDDADADAVAVVVAGEAGEAPPSPPPPRRQLAFCSNVCSYAFDGDCDDGGPDSDFSVCSYGSDCADCGVRDPGSSGYYSGYYSSVEACPGNESGCVCTNECESARNMECEDGGEGSSEFSCPLGSDCRDCGPR